MLLDITGLAVEHELLRSAVEEITTRHMDAVLNHGFIHEFYTRLQSSMTMVECEILTMLAGSTDVMTLVERRKQ